MGALLLGVGAAACGGGEPEAQVPIARERPEDQVLRVARTWTSDSEEKGFRTAPSQIATFSTRTVSRLVLEPGAPTAQETLTVESTFKLQDGRSFACQAGAQVKTAARFGDHAGESAVELGRPALRLERRCTPAGFPEPALELPAAVARFALRGDRLVAFAPAMERREYLPAD